MSAGSLFIVPGQQSRQLKVFSGLSYRERRAMRRCMAYVTSAQMYRDYLATYPDESEAELRRKGYRPERMSTGQKVTALRLIDGE